jgi:hypothetical protein
MTKLLRSLTISCVVSAVLLLAGICGAQTRPPVVEKLAKTYGLDSYGQVDAIRYTFNIEIPAFKLTLSRSWEWEPKTGKVSYESKDKDGKPVKVSYNRSQLNSAPANVKDEIEPAFVNDNYWVIFPLHVYWDTSANVEVKDDQKLPIGPTRAGVVDIRAEVEATRRSTWDLTSGRMGESRNSSIIVADPNRRAMQPPAGTEGGPLLFSTDHRGRRTAASAGIFTNVAVKVADRRWVDAK